MRNFVIGFIATMIAAVFVLRPFAREGFFSMHDDTQVGRVVAMGRAIRAGQFPVRWVSDLGYGYGYPIYNFYGPLPYYAGGVLYALGVPALMATKIMFMVGILAAAAVMYVMAARFFGSAGGLVAAVLYTYAPYHAAQVYIRGSVGEFWTLVFLPLILWGIAETGRKTFSSRFVLFVVAIGLFGVITSHTILGYVVIALYAIGLAAAALIMRVDIFRHKGFQAMAAAVLLGLGLSAFFWLPAAAEMRYTSVSGQVGPTARYSDHFVCLWQLWDSPWGFAGSSRDCFDGMSFRLGKTHVLLALIAAALWLWRKAKASRPQRLLMSLAIGVAVFSVFMMLHISLPLWRVLPNFSFVQYPWRFLTFAILGLSILGGSLIIWLSPRVVRIAVSLLIVVGSMYIYQKLFVPQRYNLVANSTYESDEELRFRVSRISDEYLPLDIIRPEDAGGMVRDTIEKQEGYTVHTVWDTDTYGKFALKSQEAARLRIHKADFPGWSYWVNGVRQNPTVSGGLPSVPIPKGDSMVEIRFDNTPIRWIGNIVSVISLFYILLTYGKPKKAVS